MTEEAKKQARAGVVVGMGALTGETKPRPRFDIDVMMQLQPETFSLFLIAMARMQNDTSLLGWFSISGIHGLPSSLWDDVGRPGQRTVLGQATALMGSWHFLHGIGHTWHCLRFVSPQLHRDSLTLWPANVVPQDVGCHQRRIRCLSQAQVP